MSRPALLPLIVVLGASLACAPPRRRDGAAPARAPDPARGRLVYLSNCIACHAADPAMPGPLGPALRGSSRDLVAARVLRGDYPTGYRPKRDTHLMKPLPQLEGDIDDLTAFLQ